MSVTQQSFDELLPAYEILAPAEQSTPFVFCSPHSGRVYPAAFLAQSRLDPVSLRKSEDCFVDELFQGVAAMGAPLIAARFPRAYVDANREPYELDPDLFTDPLPDYANTQSARVIGGLGTIPRIVADGEDIYPRRIPFAEAQARIDQLYKPFHAALAALIENTRRQFGYAILVDCHSMPSTLLAPQPTSRPDFVLGDRYGASCDPRLMRLLRETIARLGYDSQINRPYAGGYITEHYGRPGRGAHALQIEINRALYLDETTLQKTRHFNSLRRDLMEIAEIILERMPRLLERRAAAE